MAAVRVLKSVSEALSFLNNTAALPRNGRSCPEHVDCRHRVWNQVGDLKSFCTGSRLKLSRRRRSEAKKRTLKSLWHGGRCIRGFNFKANAKQYGKTKVDAAGQKYSFRHREALAGHLMQAQRKFVKYFLEVDPSVVVGVEGVSNETPPANTDQLI